VVCKRTDSPTTDSPGVFGSFLTARMGVSVGRLPQEVLDFEQWTSHQLITCVLSRMLKIN
jgi:hypothetical protein